jgi:hypothetical protein
MKPVTITNLDEVILYSLQQKIQSGERGKLSFLEIWRACEKAAPNLILPFDPHRNRRQFVASVFGEIKRLEMERKIDVICLIHERIDHITLTDWGMEYLESVVFTNQKAMGIA